MRDIIFKGKRKDNSEWVEGYLFDDNSVDSKRMFVGSLVITEHKGQGEDVWDIGHSFYEVLPETVGQYTGLTDKNGKSIFEGDIVKVYDNFDYVGETLYVGKVKWNDTFLNWELKTSEKIVWQLKILPSVLYYEVIGNVFDNPELLEVT
jgi:uncharacterized phage protein (TIGR01671 family)